MLARLSIFLLLLPAPPRSPLFPYTTLFRSGAVYGPALAGGALDQNNLLLQATDMTTGITYARTKIAGVWSGWNANDGSNKVKDRKSTRLNSSHLGISYAVFCLKKKKRRNQK